MTIKEAEDMLGMTRANIRYYEQEGLLHPKRQKNGYRNYSGQDITHLKKIKLLRELDVPIADIKKLQRGELLLPEEMQHRIAELEQQKKESEHKKAICTDILQERASYQQLDADRYLYGAFGEINSAKPTGNADALCYLSQDRPAKILPFRRFLARLFDLLLLLEVSICIISLFHENYYFFLPLIDTMAVLQALSIIIEPILLHFTGTTIGKWIFGFSLTDLDGRRLTYRAAFWRTVKLYFFGMGFSIPFLNLYRLYKSYKTVDGGWKVPWDDEVEYIQEQSDPFRWLSRFPNDSWRYATMLVAFLAIYAVTYGCTIYALIPENRGNITLEEFVENYNQAARYFGYTEYFYRLKTDGTFYTSQESYQKRAEKQHITGSFVIDLFDKYEMPSFTYTFDGKYLKQVTMHMDLEDYSRSSFLVYPNKPMTFAALAFAGAQYDVGFLNNEREHLAKKLLESSFAEGFSYEMGGMDIICNVSSSGFSLVDETEYLMAGNENNWLYFDFTIRFGT